MLEEQIAFLRTAVPAIAPLPGAPERPFWSVVIPAYGRPVHLAQALGSVLDQDPGPADMTIDVVDDASPTDEIRQLVTRLGGARVRYFRQPRNLGTYGNVNDGLRRAEGRWIHVLNDDDHVEQGFYARLRASLPDDDRVGAALTPITIVAEAAGQVVEWPKRRGDPGVLHDWLETVATQAVIQTPAVVVRREVYEALGGYNADHAWCADWEMWQRIAAHYDWWYEPRTRAYYRDHAISFSGSAKHSGSNVADLGRAIAFAQNYLPPERAADIRQKATEFWARFAYFTARRMIHVGDVEGACAQLSELLRLYPVAATLRAVTGLREAIAAPRAPPPQTGAS